MSFYRIGRGENVQSPRTRVGEESLQPGDKGNPLLVGGIIVGGIGLIYGLSPGARHYYKHGKLPR